MTQNWPPGPFGGGLGTESDTVRLEMVPEASFTSLQVLTRLSETVTGSTEISPRRDQGAVVGRDSHSGRLSEGLGATSTPRIGDH